ncbi:hypothetical protein ACMSI6_17990 [Pseudomonas antarctica]|uniref:hypothetical protein n=1 Tax=Pseudomonas antarctica TaxID=219572 RepID=UPI0039C2035B
MINVSLLPTHATTLRPTELDRQKTNAPPSQKTADRTPPSAPNVRPILSRAGRALQHCVAEPGPFKAAARQFAEAVVKLADRQLAVAVGNSLVNQLIAAEKYSSDDGLDKVLVPPDSTFGQAWSTFADALESEPFKSFAAAKSIDISHLFINANGELYEKTENRVIRFFPRNDPEWSAASSAVLAAVKTLTGGRSSKIAFYGRDKAPADTVAAFYGLKLGNIYSDNTLPTIDQLLRDERFSALSSDDPLDAPIKQKQRQARERIAGLPPHALSEMFKKFASSTAQQKVQQADRALAQQVSRGMMKLLPETSDYEISPSLAYIPQYSTFNLVRKNLLKALTGSAFTRFAQENNLDPTSVRINPVNGALTGKVNGVNTPFSLNDVSGWTDAWDEIRDAVQHMAAGSDAEVTYPTSTSALLYDVMAFYNEPPPHQHDTRRRKWETRQRVTTLSRIAEINQNNGFKALIDATDDDPASQAVRDQQQAVTQQLSGTAVARSPLEALAAVAQARLPKPPPAVDPMAAIARRQFAGEPNVYSVVARLLSERIKQAAPSLDVDVNHIALETPDADTPGSVKRTPLMTLAMDYLAGGEAPNVTSTDRAFDTRPDLLARTGNAADVPLNLDLTALSGVIRALPGLINPAYDADSREYWNQQAFSTATNTASAFSGSHRALVSRILRSNLQLASLKQPGLDEEQRKTVDMVVRHPEGSTRPAPLDPHSSKATVYTLAGSTPNTVIHRYLAQSNRAILLLVEPTGKITPYSSWDDLEKAGHAQEELTGNMFDAQADTLIKQHRGDSLFKPPAPAGRQNPTQAKTTLPDWMSNAGEAERFVMHELSQGLASFIQRNKGRAYNSDIKDIRAFAQQQFDRLPESQKLTQHAAENLEVVFKVPYGTLSSGFIDRQTMSLTDMLLNNLSGLPNGQIEVFFKSGLKDEHGADIKVRVPALEKEGVLKTRVTDLDIGKTYPALLKEKLLDDPAKMAERRALFGQQVPIELQLKALELSIKGQAGFNPTGFRYVQAILQPGPGPKTVDGREIVIRPLAFDNKAQGKIDGVEGAYLIEPKDSTTGPHILYRPLMADAPLLQFPTRQALLHAIQQPGKLQNDTLAWLPDDTTRQLYRGNGFKHPNLVIFGFNLGSISANQAIPLAVDTRLQPILQEGKLMEYLYDANAQNLITLAGQQSTSDAQSRWASLKTGGFLLLNAVLPALRGPGAILGLLLQAEGIFKDLEVLGGEGSKGKDAALTDLLVNLATVLAHFKTRPLPEQPTARSARPATRTSLLVDDVAPPTPQSTNRIVLGGAQDIKPLSGDIQAFVDSYNGKQRLNIMGHGEKPLGQAPAYILGEDGKRYEAADIDRELLARGLDIRDYSEARLLACYSSNGGEQSLAAKLFARTGVRVKGFEQEIITDYLDIDDENPFKIYEEAKARYRTQYPAFSDRDIHLMAEKELNRKLAAHDINFNVMKDTGTQIELNIGSDQEPVIYRTKVDYQPRTFGPPKVKPPVEVMMGYSHTAEDPHTELSTRSLTDCSALAVLTDLKDGVYQKRTLMHLTGSNLEFGLFDKDAYQVLDELNTSLAKGGKVIFVGGIDSQSTVGMGVVVGQAFNGKKPLLDILKKPGVQTTIASSLGVSIKPDGSFKLIEGTGKGVFNRLMINDVFDFAS